MLSIMPYTQFYGSYLSLPHFHSIDHASQIAAAIRSFPKNAKLSSILAYRSFTTLHHLPTHNLKPSRTHWINKQDVSRRPTPGTKELTALATCFVSACISCNFAQYRWHSSCWDQAFLLGVILSRSGNLFLAFLYLRLVFVTCGRGRILNAYGDLHD